MNDTPTIQLDELSPQDKIHEQKFDIALKNGLSLDEPNLDDALTIETYNSETKEFILNL